MAAPALYRKWRPQLWDEVVGQEHVVQTLRNALRAGRPAHAYLFAGPRGCGKTTTARLVAKALNCLHPDPAQRPDNTCAHCLAVNEGRFLDLIEIDGASNNGVDNIRDLRDKINFAPGEGRFKIYIIDEVHMLSLGAFNALLKTLEEPPPHAVFILATTESYKIPATVASRCQRFEFRRIPVAETVARLQVLCAQEGLQVEPAALEMIARQATGSLRDAISLLDQLVAAGSSVSLAQAQDLLGTAAGQTVQTLAEALAAGEATRGLDLVHAAVDAGADPRQLARQLVDYLRALMLVRLGSAALVEAPAETRAVMARQAERWDVPALLRAVRAFNAAANDARGGWQPQLPLELAVVECATPAAEAAAPSLPLGAGSDHPEPAAPPQHSPPAKGSGQTRPAAQSPASKPTMPARRARLSPDPEDAPSESPARGAKRGGDGEQAAAQPTAGAPETAPSAAAGPGPSPAQLRSAWEQMIQTLLERNKISKLTEADLRVCQLEGMQDGLLLVSTRKKVFFEKIQARQDVPRLFGDVLSEQLGVPCAVKFQLGSGRANSTGEVPPDGMVAAALRELGGEIIE